MLFKDFDAEIKSDNTEDGGYIIAYASTFDRDPDSYGDIVAKGAFVNSLAKWQAAGKPIPLLFGHRTDDPEMNIGAVVDAKEDDHGLLVKAVFDAESEKAQYCRKLVQEGRLYKLSFAYEVLDAAHIVLEDGRKANELRELDIFEVSLVPIPANQHAQVVEVKSDEAADHEEPQDAIATATVRIEPDFDMDAFEEAFKAFGSRLMEACEPVKQILDTLTDALVTYGDLAIDEATGDSEEPIEQKEGDPSPLEASEDGGQGAPEVDGEFLAQFYKFRIR